MDNNRDATIVGISCIIGIPIIVFVGLYAGYSMEISESKYCQVKECYKDVLTTELDDGYISFYEYEQLIHKHNRKNITSIIKSITPCRKIICTILYYYYFL